MSDQTTRPMAPAEFGDRLSDLWGPLDEEIRWEAYQMAERIEAAESAGTLDPADMQRAKDHLAYIESLAHHGAYVTTASSITGSDYGRVHVAAQMRAVIHAMTGYEMLALAVTAYERWAPVTNEGAP